MVKNIKEPDISKYIAIFFVVLGIYFIFIPLYIVALFFFVLSAIPLAFWLVYQRIERIEQKIEMINNHCIKNDERLHKIEQDIKKAKQMKHLKARESTNKS